MIEEFHIEKKKEGRYAAEYTTKCGWIDWNHADGDRPDLLAIFEQLPIVSKTNRLSILKDLLSKNHMYTSLGLSLYALKKSRNRKKVNDSDYFVGFGIDKSTSLAVRAAVRETYLRFIVPKGDCDYYKRAAFTMFQQSCELTEDLQKINFGLGLTWTPSDSHYSMEDLTSNTIAFYMHCQNLKKEDVIKMAGGWVDPEEAKINSLKVYKAMLDDQPENKNWLATYLRNDVLGHLADNRKGWNIIPKAFRSFPILNKKRVLENPNIWRLEPAYGPFDENNTCSVGSRATAGRMPEHMEGNGTVSANRIPGYVGKLG